MRRERHLIEGVTGHLRLFWGASAEALAGIAAQSWALAAKRDGS